ncbi:PPK2 family polyphosphate kinase [Kozakia baliensis]|uniref:Polyphosphate--nucleotide phosphotransferase n=1 Tax=Kozakia baliensis TaxID=153496 RepID=A0A1D8UQF7_9PROT|nr:PPK2 family polyphosphate kinase [Kozakia baliensis]AOX15874.1 polyphosphate--nucleotide phosphotransferase [Kozakia baliensis]GBR27714.1 hypothetical protein AA0488_1219 [Kozakia baliensis NRIC 0488]GEL64248.1 hypothetical protein KBA01_15340 [Kozakia baliensis]
MKEIAPADLSKRFRVEDGEEFRLSSIDPGDRCGLNKAEAKAILRARREHLAALQERLAADKSRSVLVVLQGMDAAGKDSMIRHVMSGMNPQGVKVTSFKTPSEIEREHDFLWRVHAAVPNRGQVGVFNRSHYEDVLISRVHADKLDANGLEGDPKGSQFWEDRLKDIRHFESYLARQGMAIVKIFLYLSPDRQRQRLLRRLQRPEKRWKFDRSDILERQFWPSYQRAYEEAIRTTAQPEAPWFVVPSDHKWLSRIVVMETLIETLEALNPEPPPPSPAVLRNLENLEAELRSSEVPAS